MDGKTKRQIALWRLGVLGALVSARLEHGDRVQLFKETAARVHQMPDGRLVALSPRTIESWYYAHKQGGFEALYPGTRADCGRRLRSSWVAADSTWNIASAELSTSA